MTSSYPLFSKYEKAMGLFRKAGCCIAACMLFSALAYSQRVAFTDISLHDLSAFKDPGRNWSLASDVWADYTKPGRLEAVKAGTGAILDHPSEKNHTHLITNQEFGDIEIELDFMMAKNSNSGVYLEGRYEVQLFDSWGKLNPTFTDCGGIYQRWDDARPGADKGYEGTAPLTNACKAPGLWQHLLVRFRAPRFDAGGRKTENARFEQVYLNGVLVQQQVEVTGPTRSSLFNDEKATGPLMLQGDHGPVAFRNIRYRSLDGSSHPHGEGAGLIIIKPSNQPYLLRSFVNFGPKKLTYIVSLGDPKQLNYSYDFKQGALLQVWHGPFMDVTDMWDSRGEAQLARPLGSIVPFSDAPCVAVLQDKSTPWPDSVAFDDLQDNGYVLDKDRIPAFSYTLDGATVSDKIAPSADGTSFTRTIQVTNAPPALYCRIIPAAEIEMLGKGLYRVNGAYYIHIDRHIRTQLRQAGDQQEMIVPLTGMKTPLTYSIIW